MSEGPPPANPFDAPPPGSPPPGPVASERVKGPAIGLIVTGAVGIAAQLLGIVANLMNAGMGAAGGGAREEMMPMMITGTAAAILNVVAAIIGVVVILGALKMQKLESYGFAMTSAVLAAIPCISPCCLLGLPIGIWAIVVLNDASVKAAFR